METGIATALETYINALLQTFITNTSTSITNVLTPIALGGVTIYVILLGWVIMRGESNDSLHTVLWKFFRIALICGVALSIGNFQSYVINGINGIQGAFISGVSGSTTIGNLIDTDTAPYAVLGNALFSDATAGALPKFGLLAAGFIVFVAQAVLFVIALGTYLLAKISLALVLGIGPAFILCAIWEPTQKFTESWIGQALHFVLLNVLVAASITMLTAFATQFAQKVQTDYGASATQILTGCVSLLVASIGLAVVMLNLNSLASALSGGVGLSGIGRDIGRAAMRGLSARGLPIAGSEGGSIAAAGARARSGASSGGATNTSGAGGMPQYQRNVLSNVRQSSS